MSLTVGTSAHFFDVSDYEISLNKIADKINDIRRTHKKPPKFIWKTSNPGHLNCAPELKPITSMEQTSDSPDPYKWTLHRSFDKLAINMSLSVGINVIDMTPLYLRPDGHPGHLAWDLKIGDCLHYCLPGPLNLFAILLYHILLYNYDETGNDDDYTP